MYSRVYVEITNVCNKNCSFCPGTKRAREFMSYENFDEITEKLKGVTKYLYFHIMGEPLLHENIADFIRLANKKGFKCAITTNGSLLDKMGEEIVKAGVYKVSISVHSFEKGEDEEYRKYINSCLDFCEYASSNKVLTVLRLWNEGYDLGRNDILLSNIKQRYGEDLHYGSRGIRIKDKFHLEFGKRFDWPDISLDKVNENVFCYGLKDHFGILCDGTVVPCCLDREGEINLGNIFQNDINDILLSKRAVSMREGFKCRKATEELCSKCGYAQRF